jgi:hypothetical protein
MSGDENAWVLLEKGAVTQSAPAQDNVQPLGHE